MYLKHRALRSQTIVDGTLQLLDTKDKWIQADEALDEFGNRVEGYSPVATCWCLDGAFTYIAYQEGFLQEEADKRDLDFTCPENIMEIWEPIQRELEALLETFLPRGRNYIEFNDHPDTTYQEVIELLKAGSEVYYR